MARRTSSLQSTDVAIAREIGSRYDDVKLVADNLDDVKVVADNTEEIHTVAENINNINLLAQEVATRTDIKVVSSIPDSPVEDTLYIVV